MGTFNHRHTVGVIEPLLHVSLVALDMFAAMPLNQPVAVVAPRTNSAAMQSLEEVVLRGLHWPHVVLSWPMKPVQQA